MWIPRIGAVALLALSAGCAASHSAPASPAPMQNTASGAAADSSLTKINAQIDNQNFSDMDIYLINGGMRILLGSAPGLSKTTLAIPPGSVGGTREVRLLADPLGGSSPIRTPKLIVPAGQNVYWTIGSDPASSFASAG
jgi:hypothetical protein